MIEVTVIGAGLAGCEAAWQLCKRGIPVRLVEMKPGKKSPAHQADGFAELVCSNSLRSDRLQNAVGLLKEEMRTLDSLIMQAAEHARVPAGGALAVDREQFSGYITKALRQHPLVTVEEREEVSIRSRDGLKLCASYLEAPNARACMLLMHGFRSWCRFDFSMVLRFYYEHGLSILLVDQRSHGRSEGKYIDYGILERYDCQQWAWYLHAKLGGRLPIFLDGVSMGASTVMMASELELPASVVGVIGDCGYNSAWEEVAYCMKQRYHLPAFPLLHAVDSLCRRRAGYSLKDTTAAKAIANSRLPLMLLHGTADTTVPVTNAAEIAAAAPFLLEKVIVEGAEHGCSYLNEPARCDEALLRFVEACSANFKGN